MRATKLYIKSQRKVRDQKRKIKAKMAYAHVPKTKANLNHIQLAESQF